MEEEINSLNPVIKVSRSTKPLSKLTFCVYCLYIRYIICCKFITSPIFHFLKFPKKSQDNHCLLFTKYGTFQGSGTKPKAESTCRKNFRNNTVTLVTVELTEHTVDSFELMATSGFCQYNCFFKFQL